MELPLIGSDQHETPCQGAAGKQHIVGTNRLTPFLQGGAHGGCSARIFHAVGQNRDGLKQCAHDRRQLAGPGGIEREAKLDLHGADARHGNQCGRRRLDMLQRYRVPACKITQGTGIEQIPQARGSRRGSSRPRRASSKGAQSGTPLNSSTASGQPVWTSRSSRRASASRISAFRVMRRVLASRCRRVAVCLST